MVILGASDVARKRHGGIAPKLPSCPPPNKFIWNFLTSFATNVLPERHSKIVALFCTPIFIVVALPVQWLVEYGDQYMEQLTRSITSTGPLVALIQAPAEVLPVPPLRVSCARTTVRRLCDCTANLAPHTNRHTYLPTSNYCPLKFAVAPNRRTCLLADNFHCRKCTVLYCFKITTLHRPEIQRGKGGSLAYW